LKLVFSKYQGSGNDFIIIDDRSGSFPIYNQQLIRFLCARNWGIGADGLILLQTSCVADFRMRIFNSDGLEADLCGNGLRCLALYLKHLGFKEDLFRIETQKAVLSCSVVGATIRIELPPPKVLHWGIVIGEEVSHEVFVVHTGLPHAVVFVEDLEEYPVEMIGKWIRFHPRFAPDGVNVNFVKVASDGSLRIRTYERGVEGETLSCGTGAAAAALVFFQKKAQQSPLRVMTKSGECLEFSIEESLEGKRIEMQGKASFVFEGRIDT
jgi:diaminopimelate epimerase